jgi:hypothetical protein
MNDVDDTLISRGLRTHFDELESLSTPVPLSEIVDRPPPSQHFVSALGGLAGTAIAVVVLALALNGRSTPSGTSVFPLETVDPRLTICSGTHVSQLILHGEPTNAGSPRIWASSGGQSDDVAIDWPPGFSARFLPKLEIVDAAGEVRAVEGDDLVATSPFWHGLLVCFEGDHVDIWEPAPVQTGR